VELGLVFAVGITLFLKKTPIDVHTTAWIASGKSILVDQAQKKAHYG
jgi:hypothetical protein